MDERTLLISAFGVGIALEALLLQRSDWQPGKLLGCMALSLLAAFPGKHETVYQPLLHVLFVFSAFAVLFAIAFKQDILPAISEKLLLSYTLIFWFAFFSYFYRSALLQNLLLIVLALPTVATLWVAWRRPTLNFTLKLVLYTWFLGIMVGLGLFQFPFYQLRLFMQDQNIPWVTPHESISAGMAFLYLAANATYLFYLIPIPAKNESWADRMQHWHAFTALMTQRFDADVAAHRATWGLLCGEALLLALDYRFHWIAPGILINNLIILPSVILFARRLQGQSPEGATAPTRNIDP
jgi:hypothetical protein